MGQAAEDMVNGLSCSWCGVYFKEPHGYPVVCTDCGDSDDYDKENDPQIAKHNEL